MEMLSVLTIKKKTTLFSFNEQINMKEVTFENNAVRGENAGDRHFLPFPTMFSTLPKPKGTFIVC